jgi:FkbM family methyltransferase
MSLLPRLLQTVDGFQIAVHPAIKDPFFRSIMERDTLCEAEVGFIRRMARPKLRVLDIDAGIGFYSLLMARLCGEDSLIYTIFSPSLPDSTTLGHESLAANAFPQIRPINIDGKKEIYEGYPYNHLDSFRAEAFSKLDLVRIGLPASLEITANSKIFLETQSPLLMVEIETISHAEKLAVFLQPLGYQLFRYLPGLAALKPAAAVEFDTHTFYAFFCKPDRFSDLAMRELAFVPGTSATPPVTPALFLQDTARFAGQHGLDWLARLAATPVTNGNEAYFSACSSYLMALEFPLSLAERYACLENAHKYLVPFADEAAAYPQRLSLAAVERARGQTDRAVKILESLEFTSPEHVEQAVTLPFLIDKTVAASLAAPSFANWVQAYIYESYETYRPLIANFNDQNSNWMSLLTSKQLARLNVKTVGAEKRRVLAACRNGLAHAPLLPQLLNDNLLNAEIWRDIATNNGNVDYFQSAYDYDLDKNLKEPDNEITKAIALCIKKGIIFKTFLDVGAADALVSITHYRRGLLRNMKIVNVEPNNIYESILTKIAAATGGLYLPFAVSDYDGEAQFQESGHEYWSSLRPPDDPYWHGLWSDEIKSRTVPVKTIATIVNEHELEGPIFLKMDVQGSEAAVLRGMEPVADKVAFVVVETIALDHTEINNILDRLGFALFDITSIAYYDSGILGWFYPTYIHKRYLPLFLADSTTQASDGLIKTQIERRDFSKGWLENELKLLVEEKMLLEP